MSLRYILHLIVIILQQGSDILGIREGSAYASFPMLNLLQGSPPNTSNVIIYFDMKTGPTFTEEYPLIIYRADFVLTETTKSLTHHSSSIRLLKRRQKKPLKYSLQTGSSQMV